MNSYCFHVRDAHTGQKLLGGMTHAIDMEHAARSAAKLAKLDVTTTRHEHTGQLTHAFHYHGRHVYLYLSAHPENVGLTPPDDQRSKFFIPED